MKCILMNKNTNILVAEYNESSKFFDYIYEVNNIDYAPYILTNYYLKDDINNPLFKTNLSEITSISLEHNLNKEGISEISGNFVISGQYKIADTSVDVEDFSYELPFSINLDEKYILDKAEIDIDDFYYEIVNDSVLSVNIDVIVALYRHPRFLKRGVFDKDGRFLVELAENVPLREPFGEPCALRFNSGVDLFAADNAAKMLVLNIFGGQVNELVH